MRNLYLILGDQLNPKAPFLQEMDPDQDAIWMAEVPEETTRIHSHRIRTAYFLSAMRHTRDAWRTQGREVIYSTLKENADTPDFASALRRDLQRLQPDALFLHPPGEYHLVKLFQQVAKEINLPLTFLPETHFACSLDEFRAHAKGRKQLRMEYFYREMRQKHRILLQESGQPEGGTWNYDQANRSPFPKSGPPEIPPGPAFPPDTVTRAVLDEVAEIFPKHPGDLSTFDWPVTPAQAEAALEDFITSRLPDFGKHQDAMWTEEPFLFHARLSAAMNVKLIDPLTVCRRAETAWREDPDRYPLEAVEGFIRQVLGWREYVRGIYWTQMPGYLERNALEAQAPLPAFYWTGQTDMACLKACIGQTLQVGYAHHIQRLMVTGLFPLLLGVNPHQVHEWYLAVYLDAVEWVEAPNTLGMSQYADGGVMASKPYAATGKYIQRMSNYCQHCRFRPEKRTGDDACPFTTLYWDFLDRHRDRLLKNPRMSLQVKNLNRISDAEMDDIRARASRLKTQFTPETSS